MTFSWRSSSMMTGSRRATKSSYDSPRGYRYWNLLPSRAAKSSGNSRTGESPRRSSLRRCRRRSRSALATAPAARRYTWPSGWFASSTTSKRADSAGSGRGCSGPRHRRTGVREPSAKYRLRFDRKSCARFHRANVQTLPYGNINLIWWNMKAIFVRDNYPDQVDGSRRDENIH